MNIVRVGLLACVKNKRHTEAKAKDLYVSHYFNKGRSYVERCYDRWYILSAKYYLLNPEELIQSYEKTLKKMPIEERREWSKKVFNQISSEFPNPRSCSLFFHTGKEYREFLIPLLRTSGYKCNVPLEGLSIGKQMQLYDRLSGQGHCL